MKAYAILDGGGVLGAALAGCVAAAEEKRIQFEGYGGTSAGSLVALLGSVGYSGRDMQTILTKTEFTSLLEQNGAPVEQFKALAARIMSSLQAGGIRGGFDALLGLRSLIKTLGPSFGIDDGEVLKKFLLQKIAERCTEFESYADVTFEDLANAGCKPLKIVASDVTRRQPVVFSLEHTGYGSSVLDAVRASTCYPFVFRPHQKNGRWLVDGGLSSNLPAFLFQEEYGKTGYPVFAFDLTSAEDDPKKDYLFKDFLQDMLSTAIDAGDELMRNVLKDVIHVPVPIPKEFDVLNFRITESERRDLFNIGYVAGGKSLSTLRFLQIVEMAGDSVQKQLQARYGDPKLYEPVLAALAKDIETTTQARDVRSAIMLPTGRTTRIVVYSYGMVTKRNDGRLAFSTDSALELSEDAGCSGMAWSERRPVVANLEEASRNPVLWKMSQQEHDRVPNDRKAMLSVPIFGDFDEEVDETSLPVGTLSIDTSTALTDTKWMDGESVRSEVVARVLLCSNSRPVVFPLKTRLF